MKSRLDAATGCIIYTGYIADTGYGLICIAAKTRSTHRLAWELKHGPIPKGGVICHRCDTPACINVDHLFLGTHQDNVADMVAKGRSARGDRVGRGRAKLSRDQVLAIRTDERMHHVIAQDYGIRRESVGNIKRRLTWKHL